MKLSDNRSLWTPAPINGKDVCWDFIIENLEQGDRKVADSPDEKRAVFWSSVPDTYKHDLVYIDNTTAWNADCPNLLFVYSESKGCIINTLHEICDPINAEPETDLYAEYDIDKIIKHPTRRKYKAVIKFYHTDPNNH